jgi:hypothetical protein
MQINPKELRIFNAELAKQFQKAVANAVPVVQEVTPVDTMRLFNSTRADDPVMEGKQIRCDLVAGGVALYGTLSEQTIKKDVDYALDIELRYHYLRGNIKAIADAIVEGFGK